MSNIYLFTHKKYLYKLSLHTNLKDIIADYHKLKTKELSIHVDYKIIIGEQKLIYIQI